MDVVDLPVVVRGIITEEQDRCDLLQSVQDGGRPGIRRYRRPDGSQRRRGEHGHQGIRVMAYESRDAVAFADADLPHGIGAPARACAELPPRHALARGLGRRDDGEGVVGRIAGRVQEVLGKVEPCAGEPGRPREDAALVFDGLRSVSPSHAVHAVGNDLGEGRGCPHAGELPHLGPKGIEVVDTPLPQRFVVCKLFMVFLLDESLELPGPCRFGRLGPPKLLRPSGGRDIAGRSVHDDSYSKQEAPQSMPMALSCRETAPSSYEGNPSLRDLGMGHRCVVVGRLPSAQGSS